MLQKKFTEHINGFLDDENTNTLEYVRSELTNFFLIIVFFVMILPIAFSLYRVTYMGWQPIFFLHIFFIVVTSIVTFKRDVIPTFYKAIFLVSFAFVAGLAGYMQFGLLSLGTLLFSLASLFSVLLLDFKYLKYVASLTIFSMSMMAIYYPDAHLSTGIDANEYIQRVSVWIGHVISYLFLVVTILLGVGFVMRTIYALVQKLKEKNRANKTLLRERDEFFSNVSHELRTPLNAILGFSSILNKNLQDEEHRKLAQYIHENSVSLLELINEVLDLSKIKGSQFEIEKYQFNAYEEIENFSYHLEGLTAKKLVNYSVDIDESLRHTFYGDWYRINQIILNLVSNSIKFVENNGNITLHFGYEDKKLVFSIEDDGIGMDAETKDKIFQPFTQADGTITRQYGGTGLGLSITQNLVNAMGGTITVQSQKGKGSVFNVSLPLEIVSQSMEKELKSEEEIVKEPLHLHALVVEDNQTNQILIKMLLEEIGVTCELASDGLEALEIYNPNQHAFVLMDEDMPNMNGCDAMYCIREKFKEKCTPIIALTANAMHGDKEKFIALGMDGYVSKPIDDTLFYKEIQRCLGA